MCSITAVGIPSSMCMSSWPCTFGLGGAAVRLALISLRGRFPVGPRLTSHCHSDQVLYPRVCAPTPLAAGCPDCVAADPEIASALGRIVSGGTPVVFVECPVVRSEYKGNPGYAYRTHPLLRITEVPTLFRWGKARPVGRLQGSQLLSADAIVDTLGAE